MRDIPAVINLIKEFINRLIPFIIALTLLFFIIGVFRLVRSSGEDDRKQGIQIISFGVVALFVMVSVWGLVNFLSYSIGFGTDASRAPQGPGVPRFK